MLVKPIIVIASFNKSRENRCPIHPRRVQKQFSDYSLLNKPRIELDCYIELMLTDLEILQIEGGDADYYVLANMREKPIQHMESIFHVEVP